MHRAIPILDIFLTTLYFFLFIIWIWLLFMVFIDIFRSHDMGGWAKGLWVIFIIVMPYLGVLVYLIARGGKMHERAAQQAALQQKAFDQYVKQTAGTPGETSADQLSQAGRPQEPGRPDRRRVRGPRRPRSWPAERPRALTTAVRTRSSTRQTKKREEETP